MIAKTLEPPIRQMSSPKSLFLKENIDSKRFKRKFFENSMPLSLGKEQSPRETQKIQGFKSMRATSNWESKKSSNTNNGGTTRFTDSSKRELTRLIYFKTDPSMLTCFNHVKFMDLGMSCLENQNKYLVAQKNMYLVESNFQTFFLRIEDNISNYEIALLKALKSNNLVLKLIKHKVINGRFAGIYHFVGNQKTLYNGIMTNKMGIYDKISYMLRIVDIVKTILNGRNPQNPLLKINILPSNLLMVDEAPYALKLISVLPSNGISKEILSAPEDSKVTHLIDQKASNVYFMGKVFYFIFFGKYPILKGDFFKEFVKLIEAEQVEGDSHRTELLLLIRRMLNNCMVDRPGLMEVYESLKGLRSSRTYFMKGIQHYMVWKFQNMKNEIDYEMLRQNVGEEKIAELNENDHSKLNLKVKNLLELMQKKDIILDRIQHTRQKQFSKKLKTNTFSFFDVKKAVEEKQKKLRLYRLFLGQQLMSDVSVLDKLGMMNDFEIRDLFYVEGGQNHSHGPLSATFQFEYDLQDLMEVAREIIQGKFSNKHVIKIDLKQMTVYESKNSKSALILSEIERLNDVFLYLLKGDLETIIEVDKIKKQSQTLLHKEHESPGFFSVLGNNWPFCVIFFGSFVLCFIFLTILVLKRTQIEVYNKKDFSIFIEFTKI